jgi:hypothetical protein
VSAVPGAPGWKPAATCANADPSASLRDERSIALPDPWVDGVADAIVREVESHHQSLLRRAAESLGLDPDRGAVAQRRPVPTGLPPVQLRAWSRWIQVRLRGVDGCRGRPVMGAGNVDLQACCVEDRPKHRRAIDGRGLRLGSLNAESRRRSSIGSDDHLTMVVRQREGRRSRRPSHVRRACARSRR